MLLNVSDVQDSELFVVPLNLRYEYFNIKHMTHSSVNNTRAPTTHRATRNTASGLKTEAGFISPGHHPDLRYDARYTRPHRT